MAYLDGVTRLGLYGGSRGQVSFSARDPSGFIPEAPRRKGGGRKKQRYVVEIDGKLINVANIAEVEFVLLQARELAAQSAQADVKTPIAPKPPRIKVLTTAGKTTTSLTIQRAVQTTQKAINRAYTNAAKLIARDNEIAHLMQVKFAEEDEEDSIIALLLF